MKPLWELGCVYEAELFLQSTLLSLTQHCFLGNPAHLWCPDEDDTPEWKGVGGYSLGGRIPGLAGWTRLSKKARIGVPIMTQ